MAEFLTSLWIRLRALILRRRLERDLDDELRFHLEMRREKLEKAGVSPAHSSSAAQRRLGSPSLIRERSRSVGRSPRLKKRAAICVTLAEPWFARRYLRPSRS